MAVIVAVIHGTPAVAPMAGTGGRPWPWVENVLLHPPSYPGAHGVKPGHRSAPRNDTLAAAVAVAR